MRLKIKEYINELDEEISRNELSFNESQDADVSYLNAMEGRMIALLEVKNDLKNRLEELI